MKMSWIDRLIAWATSRRVPWWVLLLSLTAVHVVSIHAVKWIDGSLPFGEFTRSSADTFYVVFGLFSYGYIQHAGRKAMDRFRPAMSMADADFEAARHDLTTMPPRVAIATAVAGGTLGIVALVSDPEALDYATTSVASTIVIGLVDWALSVGLSILAFVLIVRMLRRITLLHRRADHIDLFHPDPAHAFASVTARAGAIVLGNVTFSAMTDPTTFENPVWIGFTAATVVLSTAAFVLPLLGIRRRLKDQKQALLDRNTARIGEATRSIETAFDDGNLDDIGALKTTLDVFNGETNRIKKASTWPWETSTVRGFVTTMLLPVFLWFLTSVLGKALDL